MSSGTRAVDTKHQEIDAMCISGAIEIKKLGCDCLYLVCVTGSCNAYCLVKIDQPVQSHATNVIRNTVNPLWDDHFVLYVISIRFMDVIVLRNIPYVTQLWQLVSFNGNLFPVVPVTSITTQDRSSSKFSTETSHQIVSVHISSVVQP